ncbi:MAG TPA: hypothetical protein VGE39_23220 [Prosthecobacter sp.]
MKQHLVRFAAALLLTAVLVSCATNDNPPCRRVTAQQFMRPHTFKGIPSDRFIGISQPKQGSTKAGKAFKEIWEFGFNHSWAIIWVPVNELPADYVAEAHRKPNRPEKPQW